MAKAAKKEKPNPEYDRFLTRDQANYILNAISRGYHDRNDYPPFALDSITDRQRFSSYVQCVVDNLVK